MEYNDDSIFLRMFQVTKTIKRTLDNCCQKYGVNLLQLSIIALASYDNMTVSYLAETLGVSKSAISQTLIKLLLKKYVAKKPKEGNKKVFNIVNLAKGKQIQEELFIMLKDKENVVESQMNEEELNSLKKLLTKYNEMLKKINETEMGDKKC